MEVYKLSQNDPVTILNELNTGKSKDDIDKDTYDFDVIRDRDKTISNFSKLDILPNRSGSHQFRYNGALVNVKPNHMENSRSADFHFLTDIPGGNEEQYFYIHAKNGRRIIRYMSGRVELD